MDRIKPWLRLTRWRFFRLDDRLLLILIAVIVGNCSGLSAVALNTSIDVMVEWLQPLRHYWWAFLLPAAGAAASSIFLEKIVREGAGHGVPEVIYAVSRYGGLLRFRSSFTRLISSCLTIGSGGSAGPEAPVVISGAAIGSTIARKFGLNERQRVTLVGCGAAGAISAIFNAPIAGMVFAVEVILGEWTTLNIIPIAIAAVSGTEISRILMGNRIAFTHQVFNIDFIDIAGSVGLGILAAAASILLTRLLRGMNSLCSRTGGPTWLRAALGGCLVGAMGLALPDVLGEGYHTTRLMIHGLYAPGVTLVFILLMAKILATSLTLGWGGSGGIFAPCLAIGSILGLTFQRAMMALWPGANLASEGCFALLGMAGLISGMLQAPLTGIFLIVEITGGWEVILPLIIISVISTTVCHYFEPASFYLKELIDHGHLLRPGTDARVLTDLSVPELLEKDCIAVSPTMRLGEFVDIVKISHRNYFPVEDPETGEFMGMVYLDDVRPYLFNPAMYDAVVIEEIMDTGVETVHPEDDLADVLRRMDEKRLFSMPVVSNNRFRGMISKATLLDRYRRELAVQTS